MNYNTKSSLRIWDSLSEDDLQKRVEDGKRLLDDVMQVAMQIVETNPKIIQYEVKEFS